MSNINHARIHFNDQGTPVASDFDDVYFSNDGGMAETDYVFLHKNGLPERWATHATAAFHIIETGFGTGANFLLTWQRFRQFRQQYPDAICQRLYFTTFEKYPLSKADLAKALSVHTELTDLCQQLIAQYPPALPGCHRLVFDNYDLILDLWLGDVNEQMPLVSDHVKADAFYLDGFAPGKNPDMWQPALFAQMARLSQPDATVATFTSAGIVKRGLQQAGFTIEKVKGFGRKREMLIARYPSSSPVTAKSLPADVAIIGGGIAALCTALSLCSRGINVTLYCQDAEAAQGASHNRQGAIYPNLHSTLTVESQLHCMAFYFARQFYQHYHHSLPEFGADWCGVLHLASNEQLQQRQQKLLQSAIWPEQLVYPVDATIASELAALPLQQKGLFFPQAGWLSPQQFCQAALSYLTMQPHFTFQPQTRIEQLQPCSTGWQLCSHNQQYLATHVVIATGHLLTQFEQTATLPINKVRGQVSHIAQSKMTALKTVICHKGYITPAQQGLHCIGATFDRQSAEACLSAQDDQENINLVQQQLGSPPWFENSQVISAKAAFRATVPDHLPISGALTTNERLYVLGGLGARGILLAPLLAEQLTCQICQEPLPLDTAQLQRLAADRFSKHNKS